MTKNDNENKQRKPACQANKTAGKREEAPTKRSRYGCERPVAGNKCLTASELRQCSGQWKSVAPGEENRLGVNASFTPGIKTR
jgi:hypothetical protein